MKFTKKVKQNVADSISVAFSELFPGKKISGVLDFPNVSHDITIGHDKNENVSPDIWIDFIFTHVKVEDRTCGLFEKTREVGFVPVYKIIVSTYYDHDVEDFFDTIFHESRHAWQSFYGFPMSEPDAEGYAKVMTERDS